MRITSGKSAAVLSALMLAISITACGGGSPIPSLVEKADLPEPAAEEPAKDSAEAPQEADTAEEEEAEEAQTFTAGTVESGVYTNAFYGLTYTVDSDMIYLTEAQLRRENGMRDEGESFDEELDRLLSGGRSYVLVEATNGDETKLFDIVCTNVIAGLSDDERKSITAADMIARVQDLSFKNITNYFENNGLRDAVIENTTIDFLGEERPAISVECPIYDTRIHQRIIFLEKDGYVAQLMVSCYGDDTSAGMLSRAQAIN